jgi:tRNA threonylcarbamoyladenosine modification (KEOPS) complex Cgi121 subunit
MPPLPPLDERKVLAVGARRRAPGAPKVPEIIGKIRSLVAQQEALVGLFDARSIAGERHILSAWAHLGRARARGESRLRDRGAELALFLAGDDQLPRAIAKVGVTDATEQFVLVVEKPRDPRTLLPEFSLVEDPSAFPRPVDATTLDRLGIDAADRAAVPRESWEGLVLERVALLELTAPHAALPKEKH